MSENEREERRQELLKQTRYYKGEEDCTDSPYVTDGQSAGYWEYESVWVRWELEQDDEYIRLLQWFQREIQKDQPLYPSVPVGLQAIFASRLAHWAGPRDIVDMEAVRQFCRKYEGKVES